MTLEERRQQLNTYPWSSYRGYIGQLPGFELKKVNKGVYGDSKWPEGRKKSLEVLTFIHVSGRVPTMTLLLQTSSDMLSAYVSRCRSKSDFLSTRIKLPINEENTMVCSHAYSATPCDLPAS
jgi:hypothetical protein